MIIYNSTLLVQRKENKEICNSSTTNRNYKKVEIEKVYKREKGLRKLLDNAPLYREHKRILIDIQVKELKKKQYSAINKGWHLDGRLYTENRNKNKSNLYHIIFWGGAPPVFMSESVKGVAGINQRILAQTLNLDNKQSYKAMEYVWYTYDEFTWHKCGKAIKDCTRTFIRITETNYIKANQVYL